MAVVVRYDHRPSHAYNAGTEHVGFSRTGGAGTGVNERTCMENDERTYADSVDEITRGRGTQRAAFWLRAPFAPQWLGRSSPVEPKAFVFAYTTFSSSFISFSSSSQLSSTPSSYDCPRTHPLFCYSSPYPPLHLPHPPPLP